MENIVANSEVKLSQMAVENLKRTIPWMRFLSIVGFVFCGFMVLVALLLLFGLGSAMAGVGKFAGIAYLLIALLMFYIYKYLFGYANGLKASFESNSSVELDAAFDMQRKFWKILGIVAIVYVALIALALIFFAASAALSPF
ncbi:MAG TPA: hypothetical protein PLV65_04975 [Tenuifilaceae bacterium]|nr:hypothetical protein [Tenuifilaceae bacterium]